MRQLSHEGRDYAGGPNTSARGQADGGSAPARIFKNEALDASQHNASDTGGGEGAQCHHSKDQPTVIKRGVGTPVDDRL